MAAYVPANPFIMSNEPGKTERYALYNKNRLKKRAEKKPHKYCQKILHKYPVCMRYSFPPPPLTLSFFLLLFFSSIQKDHKKPCSINPMITCAPRAVSRLFLMIIAIIMIIIITSRSSPYPHNSQSNTNTYFFEYNGKNCYCSAHYSHV